MRIIKHISLGLLSEMISNCLICWFRMPTFLFSVKYKYGRLKKGSSSSKGISRLVQFFFFNTVNIVCQLNVIRRSLFLENYKLKDLKEIYSMMA